MAKSTQHPFGVKAFFKSSVVLTFAVDKNQLKSLIPTRLELDTFEDKWAFIAIAMVQTEKLRPAVFPEFLGNDFFLVGYRIFVRYKTKSGKNLRGLYILKSETDKRKMQFLGNIFTNYNYGLIDVLRISDAKSEIISSQKSGFEIHIDRSKSEITLPVNSVFSDWKQARRFAGPLPFTFSFDAKQDSVTRVEGVRQNWEPKPIAIPEYHFSFLDTLNLQNPTLTSAFEIENVPYSWKKGIVETWK
ncbi:DUF2071 domain-containing protein [Flavobacterium silvaticum]|uniref:DUF2071 domain-containing protein n=1 Tax=Flavobacterium silvaticum TaxID=1852020 RepID=A0A972FTQ8_9FLAO|nr:DUF2071 domain-containing protein [Flavobacterium silvaticum]NMH28313.1 hypothetical protein [Flavobacterium silvaticum]